VKPDPGAVGEAAVTPASRPVTVNTEWLSTCGGCEVAIVDLHEKILDVLGVVRIQRCPVLTDVKDYPPADVGIISGAVRTEHDREAALHMRESCRSIVAWGTCGVYGGIPGAGNVHSADEILDTVYRQNPTTKTHDAPSRMVDPLAAGVTPLDEVIDVDLYLPGCPPHPAFVFDALLALVKGRPPKAKQETVCARCQRTMVRSDVERVRGNHEGLPDTSSCFLSQGYVCLGSVTLDRCAAPCPDHGMMCTGCAGPTPQILTEPNRDIRTEVAHRMARLTRIPEDAVVKAIERDAKAFYSYSMATRMIGRKPTFLIKQWIAEAEADR
jgi:F420-non-reducing hydrogenase small subunit